LYSLSKPGKEGGIKKGKEKKEERRRKEILNREGDGGTIGGGRRALEGGCTGGLLLQGLRGQSSG